MWMRKTSTMDFCGDPAISAKSNVTEARSGTDPMDQGGATWSTAARIGPFDRCVGRSMVQVTVRV